MTPMRSRRPRATGSSSSAPPASAMPPTISQMPVTQTSVGGGRFALALVVGLGACVLAGAATYFYNVDDAVAKGPATEERA